MKRLLFIAFFFTGLAEAGLFKTIYNPFTTKLDYVNNIDASTGVSGDCVEYDGSGFQVVPCGTSFAFSVASFGDSISATQEMGSGTWKAIGAVTFTASYNNGPATSGAVSYSGWGSSLQMGSSFQGPTVSTAAVTFPSVTGTVVFTLNAAGAAGSGSASITHTFNNDRFWGVSPISSGTYSSADVRALATSDLTNSIPNSFTVAPGVGQYIVYAYPSRLGTASFSVNGFPGGFNSAATASVTNASGFTENFSVYSSVNSNLGSTTVDVTTP